MDKDAMPLSANAAAYTPVTCSFTLVIGPPAQKTAASSSQLSLWLLRPTQPKCAAPVCRVAHRR
eukprot:2845285-Rhodomonas_salina.1